MGHMAPPGEPSAPGWYGKLPSLGDFASRRLPHGFIQAWDTWLQAGLDATRGALGPRWEQCYLTAPIWRFVVLPHVVGPAGWAGVLMPSVDRVGRPFPLTVASELPNPGSVARTLLRGSPWFDALEQAALSALDVTLGPDDLDRRLREETGQAVAASSPEIPVGCVTAVVSADTVPVLALGMLTRSLSTTASEWQTLWWTHGREEETALMLGCRGLPDSGEFLHLLRASAAP